MCTLPIYKLPEVTQNTINILNDADILICSDIIENRFKLEQIF